MYQVSSTAMTRQIFDMQMSSIKQMRRALDYEARRYYTIGVMLSRDKYVQRVIDVDQVSMDPNRALSMQQIRTLIISSQNGTGDSTAHMQMYLQKSGYIIDGQHALPMSEVYRDSPAIEYENRSKLLNDAYFAKWIYFETADTLNRIYFMTTIQTGMSNALATLMVEIRSSYLESILMPFTHTGNGWVAMYGDGIIYESNEQNVDIDWKELSDKEGQFVFDGNLISYIRSDVTSDVIVSAVSKKELLAPLASLRNMIYGLLSVMVLACGILSYLLAMHNFRPLKSLVSLMPGMRPNEDEYAVLRQNILEAADQKQRLLYRRQIDERLKKDYIDCNDMLNLESWDKLPFPQGGYYCLAEIVLIDYTDNCTPTEAMLSMREMFELAPHPLWQTKIYQRGDELIALIHMQEPRQEMLDELTAAYKTVLQHVKDDMAADCIVGISDVKRPNEQPGILFRAMETEARLALLKNESGESVKVYRDNNNEFDLVYKRFLTELSENDDAEKAIAVFSEEVRSLINEKNAGRGNTEFTIKQKVIEIVQKEYADSSLSVSQIASRLGYSADYVSKAFKHTTLIGMLDYIHHVRVMTAKRMLLENKDMSIAETSRKVGYSSIDSFVRAFKRILGTTPGEFRKNAISSENAGQNMPDSADKAEK